MKGINVLSLFDGMSCGQLALKKAGIKVNNYYASEIDKYAIEITQKNFPKTVQLGDITKLNTCNLPKIDLLIGGSPCQGFSFAGKGLNFDDDRSKLFFDYVRVLKETKPKYFLLENVKMKKTSQDVISDMLGVNPICINSSLVSAQNRNRQYWTNINVICPPIDRHVYIRHILENKVEDKYYLSQRLLEGFKRNKEWYRRFKPLTFLDKKSGCLTARYFKMSRTDPYFVDTKGIRRFTPLECERLQTVPDGYTCGASDTQRYKMLGNGWTVDVIAHIFSFIKHL